VVDEAVLALTGYKLRDPRSTFYRAARNSLITLNSNLFSLFLTQTLPKLTPVLPANDEGVITIMYFTGRVLRFEVKNEIAIMQLKALVQERDGLPPATQRLLYNGKQLTDEGTLASQGVPNGATINLVLRLFGGGVGDDKVWLSIFHLFYFISQYFSAPSWIYFRLYYKINNFYQVEPTSPDPIRIRTNMSALAYFGPNLRSGPNGKITAKFTLPDSLTRYRVMAVANTIDQFGSSEGSSLLLSAIFYIFSLPLN
jgi:ubiquitin-like protein Nedd8